jgi:hypothetical protein
MESIESELRLNDLALETVSLLLMSFEELSISFGDPWGVAMGVAAV